MKTRRKRGAGDELPETTVEEEGDVIKVTFGGGGDEESSAAAEAAEAASNIQTQFILQTDDGSLVSAVDDDSAGLEDDDIAVESVWGAGNNALRDLLVYLVRKHHIDEVYDSRVKATNWEKLMEDFTEITHDMVGVTKTQVIRKWHNWKQYNKQHGKPHPFVVAGDISVNQIMDRVAKLVGRAREVPALAKYLAKGGMEPMGLAGAGYKIVDDDDEAAAAEKVRRPNVERLTKLRERDFKVRRTGVSAMTLTVKKLEHEIALESLNYEQEKWKVKLQNNKLIQQKLQRECDMADLKLERAKLELEIKRHECSGLGIPLPN